MSDDLVTWLRTQLDDDAAVANSATSGPWNNDDRLARDAVFAPAIDGFIVDCDYGRMGPFAIHNATHIARWDPARVLAEVEAKRKILDLHAHYPVSFGEGFGCGICAWDGRLGELANEQWCATVRLLALPFASRPGYREEWRP